MHPRRVLILLALLTALVSSACAGAGTPAATVNGVDISRGEVNDLVDHVAEVSAGDESLASTYLAADNVVIVEVSSAIVSLLVVNEAVEQALASAGVTVSAADREALLDEVDETGAPLIDSGLPEIDALIATQDALIGALQESGTELGEVDVRVDPRYGIWDPQSLQVIPPSALPSPG